MQNKAWKPLKRSLISSLPLDTLISAPKGSEALTIGSLYHFFHQVYRLDLKAWILNEQKPNISNMTYTLQSGLRFGLRTNLWSNSNFLLISIYNLDCSMSSFSHLSKIRSVVTTSKEMGYHKMHWTESPLSKIRWHYYRWLLCSNVTTSLDSFNSPPIGLASVVTEIC